MIYRLNPTTPMTPTLISRYIEHNRVEAARRANLMNYYGGKHAIASRTYADSTKPNNKISNDYPHYITDSFTGYFMGEPIQYKCTDEDLQNKLAEIFRYNDENSENSELAKNCSVCGVAYELMWIDEDGNIRFTAVDPIDCIAIYDTGLAPEMLYFLRPYVDYDMVNQREIHYVEVYSRTDYSLYKLDPTVYTLVETHPHSFGMCPAIEFKNNNEMRGDFEGVVSLIDAYDAAESDSVNEQDYLADAYLVLKGMLGTTSDDIADMKTNRVLSIDTDASVEWLSKNSSDTQSEDIKTRLDTDIHKFSGVPDMSDENFANNSSGVALRYKLLAMENLTAKKESAFKKGIQKRLEIICNYLSLLGSSFDYTTVELVFSRNLPANLEETVSAINQMGNLISEKTAMAMLPIDLDYEAEQEQKKKEQESGYSDYNFGDDVDA